MKAIVIAALITVLLAVGGVAIAFGFRVPANFPKAFSPQGLRQEEISYRAALVGEARSFGGSAIEPLLAQATPQDAAKARNVLATLNANLEKLGQALPTDENNRLVNESVGLLRGAQVPQLQDSLNSLADQVQGLLVRWEPDLERLEQGRFVYKVRCATCHGVDGQGNPVTPEGLPIVPRDFTGKSHRLQRVVFKFNTSNRPDMLALDADLRKTIRQGLPGTPMPGFPTLKDEEVDALLDYIKSFGYAAWKFNQPTSPALQVPRVPADLNSQGRISAGRTLFTQRGCLACHGDIEQGGQPIQGLVTDWLKEGKPVPITPRDFATVPLKRPDPQDVFTTVRLGVKGTPMPSNALSDQETWDLIAYVLHLRRLGLEGKIQAK